MLTRRLVVAVFLVIFSVVAASAGTVTLSATGQTKCYDAGGAEIPCAGTGQDGEHRAGVGWPSPRFVKMYCDASGPCADQSFDCDDNDSTDMVNDNLTGLIWARDANLGSAGKTWGDSLVFANDLTLCGYSDWRLPNAVEIEGLVHRGQSNQQTWLQLAQQGFVNVQSYYWSSTTVGPAVYDAWFLSYDSDALVAWGYANKSRTDRYLWPVRGSTAKPAELRRTGQTTCYDTSGSTSSSVIACAGTGQDGEYKAGVQWPGARFTLVYCDDLGPCADQSFDCDATDLNDIMKDNLTGLLWTAAADPFGTSKTWSDALTSVNNLTLCGDSDWRLPNASELKSLVNFGPSNLSNWLATQGFTNLQQYYWSSTTFPHNTAAAYRFLTTGCYSNECYDGLLDLDSKSATYYAWPVKGGCTGTFADVPVTSMFAGYIKNIYCAGITTGCTQNPLNYCPNNNVTRMAMAAFIIRAKYGEVFSFEATPHFTDVPDTHPFFKYIQKMKDEGLTTGCNSPANDQFCPGNTITRQAMAAFIIRATHGESFTYTPTPWFPDVPNTHPFFKYIQKMRDDEITTGYADGTFKPGDYITRQAMAAFIARTFLGMP
jgi:hypothetical protein